jgi:hypothetical protein
LRRERVAAASAAITSFLCRQSFSDISHVMGKGHVSVKNKVDNLGLSLKNNIQSQFPIAVSSLSSSSKDSKLLIQFPLVDAVCENGPQN